MKIGGKITALLFLMFSALPAIAASEPASWELPKEVYYKCIGADDPTLAQYQKKPLPFFQPQKGTHFIKIQLNGIENRNEIYSVKLPFLNCDSIDVFIIDKSGKIIHTLATTRHSSNLIWELPTGLQNTDEMVFKIKSTFAVFFPAKAFSSMHLDATEGTDFTIYSMYFGIIIIMFLYNAFLFYSTRSRSYLYYCIYTLTFGIAQFCLNGFFHMFISTDNFALSKQNAVIFSGISGMFGILFFNSFLETKTNLPRLRKLLFIFFVSYAAVVVIGLFRQFSPAFNLLNLNGIAAGIICLVGSGYLVFSGHRPARFYFFAWLTFILSLVLFIMTNVGVAPYNGFTKFLLPIGSAIEISLLSFALADKINILSRENETLIREQNIKLEQQVTERTAELMRANENLKETQTQLVNSEKMASLGHLTAGIAHEINNPINFISANISPLRRDIEDYELIMKLYSEITENNFAEKMAEIEKTSKDLDLPYLKSEIETLLKGIDEGAKRTSEIVKNLKIFSHIDKAENSYYSINEGITSTLHLLSHKLGNIEVKSDLSNLPPILCFPGKLNQVFMNLLSNALDAVQNVQNPFIEVKSYMQDDMIIVDIIDNGHGIPKEILKDIFNPFFTTKDVGSGTGLGLSITISIIHEHGGDIKVESEPGQGSKFTVSLPIKL